MTEPVVKVCKHHGGLTLAQVNVSGKNRSGTIAYKCKECQKALHQKNYARNKEQILKRAADWRSGNRNVTREQYLQWKSESNRKRYTDDPVYRQKCIDRLRQWDKDNPEKGRARRNKSKRKIWSELGDYCVKQNLKKRFDFKVDSIDPVIIELNRVLMKVKREIKQKKGKNK